MNLDLQVCSRARQTRDARFDGKFFIAVVSTRIYCRPICPVRTLKESSVRYYASAAAAAEAGYRPCLRCRPESSPGTPAWLGTSSTVSRALRLISEDGLENGVEALADRLGVGSRHLRRLFLKHLGATPIAVAHTRRLHFAKKLIDETTLPMYEVALASGFGSIRRFNAGILKVYHRTPTQIRHLARQPATQPEHHYLFRLSFRPPFHWQAMLDFLALRATPGVEAVEAGVYRRTIFLPGGSSQEKQDRVGHIEVSRAEDGAALLLRIAFSDPQSLFFIVERVRAMFDLNADWSTIAQCLRADPALAHSVDADPGVRVPGAWNGFELAVRAILGQQITVKGATTLAGRLAASFGKPYDGPAGLSHLFPTPEALAQAPLVNLGLTGTRVETIRALARAAARGKSNQGSLNFDRAGDAETTLARLLEIPGIGHWTAQYVAMRALGEPDAFPSSDLGLLKALALETPRDLEQRSQSWRPWRAYAAMYLWRMAAPSGGRAAVPKREQLDWAPENISRETRRSADAPVKT